MFDINKYKTIPVGSLLLLSEQEAESYTNKITGLPESLVGLLMSWKTGAFLRGVANTYDLDPLTAPQLSLLVLRICFGERPISQLGGLLSALLRIPNDKAMKIAEEIERELFVPVMIDLNSYIAQQKNKPSSMTAGASNVINLKNPSIPPRPPAPSKPVPPV